MVGIRHGNTGTGSRMEAGFYHPVIETARIVNVNVGDYTVDAVSEYGNRRFFDIQVMSPYFHYANGEGWYAVPEVGAMCWVCQESPGLMGRSFVLGYQAPNDQRTLQGSSVQAGNFKSNRQTLNPGDQMWRGRDENFVILRRGGVVQIGASPANQRIFIPLGSLIRDFCFGYELQTLSGDLMFVNDRQDQDDAGNVKTRFRVRAKTHANEKEHAVILIAGSHEDDSNLRLSLQINASGDTGAAMVTHLTIDKAGSVNWAMEKDYSISAKGNMTMLAREGDLTIQAVKGKSTLQSKGDVTVKSDTGSLSMQSKGDASLKGANLALEGATISAKGKTQIGGPGGEPIPKGLQLTLLLAQVIDLLTNPQKPAGITGPPGSPMLFPGLLSLLPALQSINSVDHTVT